MASTSGSSAERGAKPRLASASSRWLAVLLIGMVIIGLGFSRKVEAASTGVVHLAEAGYVTKLKNIVVGNMPIHVEEQWPTIGAVNIGLREGNIYESVQRQFVSRKNHSDGREDAHRHWFELPFWDAAKFPTLGVNLFQFEQGNRIAGVFDGEADWGYGSYLWLKRLVKDNRQPSAFHDSQAFIGNSSTLFGGFSTLSGDTGLSSYSPPLEASENGINDSNSNSKQAIIYPPRLLIGTVLIFGGSLLIGYGTKGFEERLFKLGWSYAFCLIFRMVFFYLGGVLILIHPLW